VLGHELLGLAQIVLGTAGDDLASQNIVDGGRRCPRVCEHANREVAIRNRAEDFLLSGWSPTASGPSAGYWFQRHSKRRCCDKARSAANRVPLLGPEAAAMRATPADFAHLAMPPGSASQNLAKADRTLQKVGGGPVTTASIGRTRVGRAGPVEDWEKNCSFPLATSWREGNRSGRSAKLTDRAWRTPHRAFTH
jgi:hypothetical protein